MPEILHPSAEDIAQTLREHYLFAHLAPDELAELAAGVRALALEPGQALFRQGEPARRFYLLLEGQIKLYRLSPEGQEKIVEITTPGKTFAEAVMFMEGKRFPVTAEALAPSLLYGLRNDLYLELLRHSPPHCLRLLADMSGRLHGLLGEIDTLAVQNASYRVQRYLEGLLPADAEDGFELELEVPKQVVAARLSIKPETLSRVLHGLSATGILSVAGRRLKILDARRLRRFELE